MQHHQRKHPVALHVMVDTTRITCPWWASGHFMAAQSDAERTFAKPWKWKKNIKITLSNLDAQQKQTFFVVVVVIFAV